MERRVDIIVPVYNVERYLEKCVLSLVNQTYKNIRVILVDDGSTDNSGSVCDCFSTQYSNVIALHQKNGGVSAARNAGLRYLKKSGGDYLTFADPDDWVESNHIEQMVHEAEQSQADIVVSGYIRDFINGNPSEFKDIPVQPHNSIGDFLAYCHEHTLLFMCWNKLFRSSIVLENELFFPEKIRQEDTDFVYEYLRYADTFSYVPQPTYHYMIYNSERVTATKKYIEDSYLNVSYPTYQRGKQLVEALRSKHGEDKGVDALEERIDNHLYVGMLGDFIINLSRSSLNVFQRRNHIKHSFESFKSTGIRIKPKWNLSQSDKVCSFFLQHHMYMPVVMLSYLYGMK